MNNNNPEQSEGTTNGSNLREAFELWAVEENYPTKRADPESDMYECLDTCIAWDAYQEAHKLALAVKPTAYYVKATGAFHLNYERITPNEFLLGVTELREID